MSTPIRLPNVPNSQGNTPVSGTRGAAPALTELMPQVLPPIAEPEGGFAAHQDLNLQNPSVIKSFISQLDERFSAAAMLKNRVMTFLTRFVQSPESLAPAEQALGAHCRMSSADIAENLRFQLTNQTAFQAGPFALLRQLAQATGSPALHERLWDFLIDYDNLRSAPALSASIGRSLAVLSESLPPAFAVRLKTLLPKMTQGPRFEALKANSTLIKNEILPLLSEYAHLTNERGPLRQRIGHIIHLLAQLNRADPARTERSAQALLQHLKYELQVPQRELQTLEYYLTAGIEEDEDQGENAFFSALTAFLSREAQKNPARAGLAKSPVLLDVLTDASIFMPYFHAILPLIYKDLPVFCDVWAEKSPQPEDPDAFLLYLSFDIRSVGSFGLQVGNLPAGYGVKLYCPESWKGLRNRLSQGVREIFAQRGLPCAQVTCSVEKGPDMGLLIRRKAAERRNGVHVKV